MRYDQGLLEESEAYHRKALAQYQSTIGNIHHRTADVCHKVAQHCLRSHRLEQAEALVEQALKVWSVDERIYQPEIARTTFLKSKVLRARGKDEEATEIASIARTLGGSLRRDGSDAGELTEEDFDQLVTFWSR